MKKILTADLFGTKNEKFKPYNHPLLSTLKNELSCCTTLNFKKHHVICKYCIKEHSILRCVENKRLLLFNSFDYEQNICVRSWGLMVSMTNLACISNGSYKITNLFNHDYLVCFDIDLIEKKRDIWQELKDELHAS